MAVSMGGGGYAALKPGFQPCEQPPTALPPPTFAASKDDDFERKFEEWLRVSTTDLSPSSLSFKSAVGSHLL